MQRDRTSPAQPASQVTRYRYRGQQHRDPLDPRHRQPSHPAADQRARHVERPVL